MHIRLPLLQEFQIEGVLANVGMLPEKAGILCQNSGSQSLLSKKNNIAVRGQFGDKAQYQSVCG
jgi:hypothetical protein